LLPGFSALSTTATGSVISSLMFVLVGGGVNIPLSQSSSSENSKKDWQKKVKEQAEIDHKKKN